MKTSLRTLGLTAAVAGTLLLVTGCHTPPQVYALAEKTGGSAGILQTYLVNVAAQSKAAAHDRTDLMIAMEAYNAKLAATLARELYMQQHARPAEEWAQIKSLMTELTTLRDDLVRIEASATLAEAARKKELRDQQVPLNTYKAALAEASAALSTLAERESNSARAKFLASFARELRSDLKKSIDDNKSAVTAKSLVQAIKDKLDGDTPQ